MNRPTWMAVALLLLMVLDKFGVIKSGIDNDITWLGVTVMLAAGYIIDAIKDGRK